ncbi:MAG TPA: RHS repeat protein, partial [Sorangium sp.]|nr:RHS repeat protein [Sorangium sp.]
RLELRRIRDGRYDVYSLDSRLTRNFEVIGDGPAAPESRIDRPHNESKLHPIARIPRGEGPRAMLTAISDAWNNRITLHYQAQRLVRVDDTAGRTLWLRYDDERRLVRVEVWAEAPAAALGEAPGNGPSGGGNAGRGAGAHAGDDAGGRAGGTHRKPTGDKHVPNDSRTCQLHVDYTYDDRGCLASVTDALGHSERFEYDTWRRMTAVQLKNGQRFYYEYDDSEESQADGSGPDGICVHTWGDGLPPEHSIGLTPQGKGLPAREVRFHRRPDGVILTWQTHNARRYTPHSTGMVAREEAIVGDWLRDRRIDKDGYLQRVTNAAGRVTESHYDRRGNLTRVVNPAQHEVHLEYRRDQLVKRTGADGSETRYHHGGYGELTEACFPNGQRFTFDYDNRGRLSAIFGGPGADVRLYAFEYDSAHNLVTQTTARGAVTRYQYDALGRPIQRTDGLKADGGGLMPEGRTTTLTLDALGRPLCITRPDGTTVHNEYDPLGNVCRHRDAQGHITTMKYGGTGVLLSLTEPSVCGRW